MADPGDRPIDVTAWLTALGLEVYAAAFAENHVDEQVLRELTQDDLRELGVASLGHRRRILSAIAALTQPAAAPPEPVARPEEESRAQQPITAQRRQVTILFSDLVGFTRLTERLDPEVMHELLRAYKDAAARTITQLGGHIVKFLGDGVLATFGYPRAQDDDAVRAVRAGLELVEAIARLRVPDGETLAARVGLATGLVVVGDLAGEAAVERDSLVGEAPNLAARLQSEAAPGEVLMAASTADLVRGRFVYESIGTRALKGFSEPVALLRVLAEGRNESRFAATRRAGRLPMVGRVAETARLLERAARAASGQGQVVVIDGEAGIGKSRLVAEIGRGMEGSGRTRLLFQASPHNAGTPFYPVIKLIEYAADLQLGDSPDQRFAKVAAALRQYGEVSDEQLALIADLLDIETAERALIRGFAPREIRGRTMRALHEVLLSVARRGTLVVIEDLQWADPSTREMIGQFIPKVAALPALVLVTMRPLSAGEAVPAWIGEAHVTRLTLDRLAADEVRSLVRTIVPEGILAPDQLDALVARSDGVPIFAEELAYAMRESGTATVSAGMPRQREVPVVPSTLTESLLARLDRLPHGLETVEVAAVIGREIPVDLLIAVSSREEAAVRAGLEELIAAGILVRHEATSGEAVAFRQSLLRDAAYGLVLLRDRQRLHRLIAASVQERFPEILERRLDFVPRHLEAAGDWTAAIASWRKAGQNAAARSAVAEAVQHFSRALELCLRQPAGADRDETELILRTELSFPLLAMRGWSSTEVAVHVDRAIALSASVEARHRIVPVLIGKWLTGFGSATSETMWTLAHQIVDAARSGGDIERLLTHRVLSSQYLFEGSLRDSLREFQAFKQLYAAPQHEAALGRSGATTHAVTIDMGLATCFALMGRLDEMQGFSTAAVEAARQTGHFNTMCQTLAAAGGFCSALVRDAAGLALHGSELAELAERHDLPFWRPHANLLQGLATALSGDSGSGLGQARQGIDALVAQKAFALSAWVLFYAAACEEAGDAAELGRALAIAQSVIGGGERWFEAEYFRLRGRSRIAAGEAAQAAADFAKALEIARTQGAGLFEQRAAADLRRFC
jgi:class 3 adenylate cyclase